MSWVREAANDWFRYTGGYAAHGYLGKHLKPLVLTVGAEITGGEVENESEIAEAGWREVRPGWQRYLQQTEVQYLSAPHFCRTYGQWTDRPRGEGRVPLDRARQMFRAAGVTPPAILPEYFNSPEAVQKAIDQHRRAS